MATRQELEELVVKMTGNVSPFIDAMSKAQAKTEASSKAVSGAIDQASSRVITGLENIGKKTEQVTGDLGKVGRGIKDIADNAVKLGEALSMVTGGLTVESALAEFREAERTTKLLTATLEASGRQVRETLDSYKAFADQIQETTSFAGDEVMEMFRLAESYDVTGDSAKRAVKNALALAEAHGITADNAIRATAALEQGSTRAIIKFIPAIRNLEDDTSKVAEAQRLLGRMFSQVEAATETSTGTLKRLNNEWNNFKQSVGEIIQRILNPFVSLLQEVVAVFRILPAPVQHVIAVVMTAAVVFTALTAVVGTSMVAWAGLTAALGTYSVSAALATAASLALKVALIGGVAFAAYEVGKAISGASEEYKKFDEAIAQSTKMSDKWAEKFKKNTDDTISSINRLSDPMEKENRLVAELQKAQTELRGYQVMLSASKREIDELNTRWDRWTGNKILELANTEAEQFRTRMELAKSKVDQLAGALNTIRSPKTDKSLASDIEKFVENLKVQNATMGMTSNQVDIYKFSIRGASSEVLEAAKNQSMLNDQLKRYTDITKNVNESTKQIKDEIKTFGMTPLAAKITLAEEALKQLQERMLDKTLPTDEFVKLSERSVELSKSLNEVNKAFVDMRKREDYQDSLKRGKDITKQFRTAQEIYNDSMKELRGLLDKNHISQQTFNRGADDAKDKLDKASQSADKYKQSLQALTHVQFGSAEALARVQQFRDTLREQVMEVRAKGDMGKDKEDEETVKKIEETNAILRRIETKPAPVIGVTDITR